MSGTQLVVEDAVTLAFGLIGAKMLLGAPARTLGSFSAAESAIIIEARQIMESPGMAAIQEAHLAGKAVVVNIGGRLVQYEPGLAASGFTNFAQNGFAVGREAFSSPTELGRTVLHELHRLTTSQSTVGAYGELVASETRAAFDFANRAVGYLFQ